MDQLKVDWSDTLAQAGDEELELPISITKVWF